MALDDTAKYANVLDSLKKYFKDNIQKGENIPVTFDSSLATPKVQGKDVLKWVSVVCSNFIREEGRINVTIYCCTKKDNEGAELAQLQDKVSNYLEDNTQTDGRKRIPFYRSRPTGAWTLLGALLPVIIGEQTGLIGPDGTKYSIIDTVMRWGVKI